MPIGLASVMVIGSTLRQKLSNAFLSLALFISSGCTETDSSHLSANHYPTADSLMPTEIWLDAALEQLNNPAFSDSSYQLFLSPEPNLENLILEFASNKELERALVEDENNLKSTLLFNNGRLTFSYHREKSGQDWIVAYANNNPYAAALYTDDQWKAIEPYIVPTDQNLISKSLNIATQYANLEKKGLYEQRILSDNFKETGEIENKKALNYRINARKGDEISVELNQAPEYVFFTFANQATSRMEYKSWTGTVETTGDIIIQVFSTNEKTEKDEFTLLVNRQNPIALQ